MFSKRTNNCSGELLVAIRALQNAVQVVFGAIGGHQILQILRGGQGEVSVVLGDTWYLLQSSS